MVNTTHSTTDRSKESEPSRHHVSMRHEDDHRELYKEQQGVHDDEKHFVEYIWRRHQRDDHKPQNVESANHPQEDVFKSSEHFINK